MNEGNISDTRSSDQPLIRRGDLIELVDQYLLPGTGFDVQFAPDSSDIVMHPGAISRFQTILRDAVRLNTEGRLVIEGQQLELTDACTDQLDQLADALEPYTQK